MSKHIVLVPHIGDAFSHLLRTITLAEELVLHGFRVSIAGSQKARPLIKTIGRNIEFIDVPWTWGHNQWGVPHLKPNQLEAAVETALSLRSVFKRTRPDAVIGVPGIASVHAAQVCGIPHFCLMHGPWLLPILNSQLLLAAADVVPLARCVLEGPASEQLEGVGLRLGTRTFLDYHSLLHDGQILIAQPAAGLVCRDNHCVIGYVNGSYGSSEVADLASGAEGRVLVSFGTAITHDVSPIINAAASVFESVLFLQGVASARNLAPNILVLNSLSSSMFGTVARHIVCHGGIGTVGGCALSGIAQLIIPLDIDQAFNAVFANQLGVAINFGLEDWVGRTTLGRYPPPAVTSVFIDLLGRLKRMAVSFSQSQSPGSLVAERLKAL